MRFIATKKHYRNLSARLTAACNIHLYIFYHAGGLKAMTNEEIVKAILGGKRELMGELYLQNRRFIFALVKHIGIKPEFYEDAMQNAYIGLHEAVKGYDENTGFKFLTYAKYHIKNAIQRGQNNDLYIPEYILNYARKIKRTQSELTASLGRLPTQAELSHKAKIDAKTITYILNIIKPAKSIYEPLGDGEENLTIADSIEDTSVTFEDDIAAADERRTVRKVLEELPEAERTVITLYYLHGITQNEIAKRLGVSPEWVRNLRGKGLRRLRHPKISRQFMENEIDRRTSFYQHRSVDRFNTTWTSSTEQTVIDREYMRRKDNK